RGNTMVSKAFTRRIEQVEKEIAQLDALLAQEAELWEGSQTAGALDPAGAAALRRTIIVEIEAARAALRLGPIARQSTEANDYNELVSMCDEARTQVRDMEAQLRRAE